jgi:hypothetical protein
VDPIKRILGWVIFDNGDPVDKFHKIKIKTRNGEPKEENYELLLDRLFCWPLMLLRRKRSQPSYLERNTSSFSTFFSWKYSKLHHKNCSTNKTVA